MIKLSPDLNNMEEKKEKYYKVITKNRKYVGRANNLCISYFNKEFKDIVLQTPDELKQFVSDYNRKNKKQKDKIVDDFKRISTHKGKATNYLVETLYKTMPDEAKELIYNIANTKTCPYCNRSFVDMVEAVDGRYISVFQQDHFYSKDEYPMLAVSLFNLIPCCPNCNRIKGNNDFNCYPYDNNSIAENDLTFSFDYVTGMMTNEDDIRILIRYNNENLKSDAQRLFLQELYEHHKDIAIEIIKKARYQGEGYLSSLLTQLHELFPNRSDIYRMIYGSYLKKEDWKNRPLSKFTYDIAKETLEAYGISMDFFEDK